MALPKPTQKQVTSRNLGNLTYFRKPHLFRMLRLVLFVLAVVVSLFMALGRPAPKFFNTGPISYNHRRFEDRCYKCHKGAEPYLMADRAEFVNPEQSLGEKAKGTLEWIKASFKTTTDRERMEKIIGRAVHASGSMEALDNECRTCHSTMLYHQPQAFSLSLAAVQSETVVARVAACSDCHREHEGPGKMADPPSSNCVDCHSQRHKLQTTTVFFKGDGQNPPSTGTVVDFRKDGVLRYVAPRRTPYEPVAFKSFQDGHPAFGYESPGARDPGVLQFNHAVHMGGNANRPGGPQIPKLNGKSLQCADCHKPGDDGAFMQPISYERHCQACHSLNINPLIPDMVVPHKQPTVVRQTVSSEGLTVLFLDYITKRQPGWTDVQRAQWVQANFLEMVARPEMNTSAKILQKVFRNSDAAQIDRPYFTSCATCHDVKGPVATETPEITRTNLAQRWLTRGPFTHLAHGHMDCMDCHAQALGSSRTTDILLPTKASCVECHREHEGEFDNISVAREVNSTVKDPILTLRQRVEGGISNNCQYCHPRFHAPADATAFAKKHQELRTGFGDKVTTPAQVTKK